MFDIVESYSYQTNHRVVWYIATTRRRIKKLEQSLLLHLIEAPRRRNKTEISRGSVMFRVWCLLFSLAWKQQQQQQSGLHQIKTQISHFLLLVGDSCSQTCPYYSLAKGT